jgi:hypothetical protein
MPLFLFLESFSLKIADTNVAVLMRIFEKKKEVQNIAIVFAHSAVCFSQALTCSP